MYIVKKFMYGSVNYMFPSFSLAFQHPNYYFKKTVNGFFSYKHFPKTIFYSSWDLLIITAS